jgi:hypothetical protein
VKPARRSNDNLIILAFLALSILVLTGLWAMRGDWREAMATVAPFILVAGIVANRIYRARRQTGDEAQGWTAALEPRTMIALMAGASVLMVIGIWMMVRLT